MNTYRIKGRLRTPRGAKATCVAQATTLNPHRAWTDGLRLIQTRLPGWHLTSASLYERRPVMLLGRRLPLSYWAFLRRWDEADTLKFKPLV